MLSETEGKFLTMHEFAKAAKNRLDANIWDYLTGATETETTMRRNRLALDTLAFRPRVLRDVSTIDTTSEMFGKKLRLPVALAPVGGLESFGANGAAKAGLNRMMRSVAIDLKSRGIVVGLVHPGYVRTDMSGPSADISPEESAASIRALTAAWTIEETGEFYKWNGEKHAW
jgi:glycolate oxidase